MKHPTNALAAAAMALGLAATACSNSPNSGTATSTSTSSKTITTSVSQATTTTSAPTDLRSLIPTPANTQRTDGPDSIQENGIHLHFFVNGSPADVMGAYKTALQGASWSVTVESSGGSGGGGGATYTGTNGNAYGVFDGGGYGSTTDVDACAWPSKPSNTGCGRHGSR
jgi:hypothetical protein